MAAGTQSIDRAAMMIDIVARGHPEGIAFPDVLERSGLTRSTARRLLQALGEHGFVRQDPASRRYLLGHKIYELGLIAFPTYDFKDIYQPGLDQLVRITGDTVFLNRVIGDNMTCIARESGTFPVKAFVLEVGVVRPIGIGASGMAVLAALPPAEAERILDRNASELRGFDGGLDRIRELVAQARESGHVDRRIDELGIRTVATAIRDSAGTPFASLSVSSILERMTGEHLQTVLAALRDEAAKISARLSTKRPIGRE